MVALSLRAEGSAVALRRLPLGLPLFGAPELEELVEVAEGYADGAVAAAAVESAREQAEGAAQRFASHEYLSPIAQVVVRSGCVRHTDLSEGHFGSFEAFGALNLMTVICGYLDLWPGRPSSPSGQEVWQLRTDVIPRDEAAFASAWRTSDAVMLAAQMYASRDFSAMPILADALQDAGCDSDRIMSHCRAPQQVHVRGCWVVDLVLGRV